MDHFQVAEQLLENVLRNNKNELSQDELAKAYFYYAQCFWNKGDFESADKPCNEAISIWQKLADSSTQTHKKYSLLVARALCSLGGTIFFL